MTKKVDPLVQFEEFMANTPAVQIGNLLAEYINESNHNSWDGHPPRDVSAYRKLFQDILTYRESNAAETYNHPGYSGSRYFTKVT